MDLDRRIVIGAAAAIFGVAGPARAEAAEPPFTLERSAVLHVDVGDRRYELMVAWPEGVPPASGWPVLYVLDGKDNFAALVTTARRLSAVGGRSGVGPGLVVGITSEDLPRRVLDYTPPVPGYTIPVGAPAAGLATGGGDAFLDVLAERIQPLVVRRWGGDPNRQTLLGHSFGGLLALHALCTRTRQFSGYLAVSPSLWFGSAASRSMTERFRPPEAWPLTILLAGSDDARSPPGMSIDTLAADLRSKDLVVHRLPLAGLSHGATMYAAFANAVALAFPV